MGFQRLIDEVFSSAVDLLAEVDLLSSWPQLRIIISPGMRSLIASIPVKRPMLGTLFSAALIPGALSDVHSCIRWIRSSRCAGAKGYVASRDGGRLPNILLFGW